MFNKLAIIGIGHIGSSIALATKRGGLAKEIALYDISENVRKRADELKHGNIYADLQSLLKGADLIILCVPCGAMLSVAQEMLPFIEKGAILSDVGSVKGEIVKAISPILSDDVFFIPAHPIAGTEFSGPDAGLEHLFEKKWCIITPISDDEKYLEKCEVLNDFWRGLGANIENMAPERHDMVLAVTSHIPHLIAFSLVATAEDIENLTESEVVKYSAGGFRDFTRIAASDPTMWRDVFLLNKEAVLEVLGRVSEDITALRRAIRWDDGDTLFDTFTRARKMRKELIDAGQIN